MQHNISEAKCPPLHKTSSDITQCHCRDPYQGKYDTNADLHLIVTAACTQMLLSIQKARKLSDKVFQLIHGSCQSEVPSHESMCSPRKFPKDVPTDSLWCQLVPQRSAEIHRHKLVPTGSHHSKQADTHVSRIRMSSNTSDSREPTIDHRPARRCQGLADPSQWRRPVPCVVARFFGVSSRSSRDTYLHCDTV